MFPQIICLILYWHDIAAVSCKYVKKIFLIKVKYCSFNFRERTFLPSHISKRDLNQISQKLIYEKCGDFNKDFFLISTCFFK